MSSLESTETEAIYPLVEAAVAFLTFRRVHAQGGPPGPPVGGEPGRTLVCAEGGPGAPASDLR